MLGWFHRMMPRTELFFPLFERHAVTVTAAAEALRRMLDDGAPVAQHCRDVVLREEEADGITRDVLVGVRSTFITPFDRGDIKDLISAMDDTIDAMQKAAKAIILYELTLFDGGVGMDPFLVSWGAHRVPVVPRLLALPDPPTAIFSANPSCSMPIVRPLHAAGRSEIVVLGFGVSNRWPSALPSGACPRSTRMMTPFGDGSCANTSTTRIDASVGMSLWALSTPNASLRPPTIVRRTSLRNGRMAVAIRGSTSPAAG